MNFSQHNFDIVENSDIVIIDNFLNQDYYMDLYNFITSADMPWYYRHNISSFDGPSSIGDFGFNHTLNADGQWVDTKLANLFIPFSYEIKNLVSSSGILRVRLDMTLFNPTQHIHHFHVDYPFPHYASIYYVNDSDGDTVIYNERYNGERDLDVSNLTVMHRIKPKANRLVIFDGFHYHTGHSPSKNKNRILINSNYGK